MSADGSDERRKNKRSPMASSLCVRPLWAVCCAIGMEFALSWPAGLAAGVGIRPRACVGRMCMQAEGQVDRSPRSRAFFDWLADSGFDGLLVPATFGSLRGMMAVQNSGTGDVLLSFPRSATMDLATVHGCPCEELVPAPFWEAQPWYMQLALWLIAEEARGADSKWAAYVATLPETVDVPALWPSAQLELLAYPPLLAGVRKQQEEFHALQMALLPQLKKNDVGVIERLEWALTVVLSRAFTSPTRLPTGRMVEQARKDISDLAAKWANSLMPTIGGRRDKAVCKRESKAMVPMLDLCNHFHSPGPVYSYDPVKDAMSLQGDRSYDAVSGVRLRRMLAMTCFLIISVLLAQGSQVFWSYGDFSNDHLLQV